MTLLLFAILLVVCFLTFFEEKLQKYNHVIYMMLMVVLILFAGLREVGFDRDSENYENYFLNYDDPLVEMSVEYSFRLLSRLLSSVFDDVHVIFLLYALVGVMLKMLAFRRLSEFFYLPVAIYIGYYYLLHDLTQIRASVVSGLTLFAILLISEGRRREAFGLLLISCLFHYSAIILLPTVFLGRQDMSIKERWVWAALVPLGYFTYFLPFNVVTSIEIPYITGKLELYENLRDKGIVGDEINVFNIVFLVRCAAYLFVLYFYDAIRPSAKCLPVMLKYMGLSVFCFLFFSKLPVMAFRTSELFGIAEIFIFTYIFYTILPKALGKAVVSVIALALFVVYVYVEKIIV